MKEKIKKVPAIRISQMGGLKCDNPNCDWEDMSIKAEEYYMYIDYKCPKCGDVVFTKRSYKSFKFIMFIIKVFNFILPKRIPDKEKDAAMTCEVRDDGKINIEVENK